MISHELLNDTPVFALTASQKEPWHRVWGAHQQTERSRWLFPAYYPFGLWAAADLKTVAPKYGYSAEAAAAVAQLKAVHGAYQAAEAAYAAQKVPEIRLPNAWKFYANPPFLHQWYGMAIGLTWWRHFFLWEMGTGKTKTVIETLRLRRARGQFLRALVLAPRIVIPTWERETVVHTGGSRAAWEAGREPGGELVYYTWEPSDPDRLDKARRADVVLATYAGARIEAQNAAAARAALREKAYGTKAAEAWLRKRAVNPLLTLELDTLVGDESHNLGNAQSDQTTAALELAIRPAHRYLLSGTAADQPRNLYAQLRFLAPGLLPMAYKQFCDTYMVMDPARPYLVLKYRNMHHLNAVVNRVASRMRKADCVDLPEQVFVDIPFEIGPRQVARYNELVTDMRATLDPLAVPRLADTPTDMAGVTAAEVEILLEVPHGAARVNKLQQVTSGFLIKGPDKTVCDTCKHVFDCARDKIKPYTKRCRVLPLAPPEEIVRDVETTKIEATEDLLDQLLDADPANKVIVWANLTPELDDLAALFKKKRWGFVRIDGGTSHKVKAFEQTFEQDPDCRIWLSQVAAGVGITLTAANFTLYYSLPWDRKVYRQALDRNYRPGQTRKVTVYRLIANRTVDPFVVAALERKEHLAYVLTEKIDCAKCPHQTRCAAAGVKPFRDGCVYQPEAARPIARVEIIE